MRSVLHEALATWGGEKQTLKVYEEMAELQKELVKNSWGEDNRLAIAEEIADVRIMLDQMCILHDCEDLAKVYRTQKLVRLAERVEKARGEKGEGKKQ